jgi:hypothetical protein
MTRIPPTWVQKNISPTATSLFGRSFLPFGWRFLNREAVMWGIRSSLEGLNDGERLTIKFVLRSRGILQSKFRSLKTKTLESYHLSKTVTFKQLILAANEIYEMTGRDDLLRLCGKIYRNDRSESARVKPNRVDYQKLYETQIKPRVLSEIGQELPIKEHGPKQEVIDQALNFSLALKHAPKGELNYRIRKIADIWGDVLTIVSSLFMDIPAEELRQKMDNVQGDRLVEYKDLICDIVARYQRLKAEFEFDPSNLYTDEKYICRSMRKLVGKAELPQVLLLLFLDKLTQARKAADASDPIFNQIRYLYTHLAKRLGLVYLSDDFCDQYLRLLYPEKYQEIENHIKERVKMGTEGAKIFLQNYVKTLWGFLEGKLGVLLQGAVFKSRVKSHYSIYNKVEIRREYPYQKLKDILGIKVICASEKAMQEVYNLLSKKNDHFVIDPKEIKIRFDSREAWRGIKLVGQETTSAIPVEIQIVTQEMEQENMRGIVADWKYALEKELVYFDETGKEVRLKQTYDRLEPSELYTSNYAENFFQIKYIADTAVFRQTR